MEMEGGMRRGLRGEKKGFRRAQPDRHHSRRSPFWEDPGMDIIIGYCDSQGGSFSFWQLCRLLW